MQIALATSLEGNSSRIAALTLDGNACFRENEPPLQPTSPRKTPHAPDKTEVSRQTEVAPSGQYSQRHTSPEVSGGVSESFVIRVPGTLHKPYKPYNTQNQITYSISLLQGIEILLHGPRQLRSRATRKHSVPRLASTSSFVLVCLAASSTLRLCSSRNHEKIEGRMGLCLQLLPSVRGSWPTTQTVSY